MMPMHVGLHWSDAALRLLLTVIAGMLIGYDRSERGKVAGMRTTLLVGLAATVAMLQVNALLPTAGRAAGSFVMNDLMRLPLGILTGVGFIGGGAILRRGNTVTGVTTAATLWLITVIGLCFGGGQMQLGVAATGLGLFALWGLARIEAAGQQAHRVRLLLTLAAEGPAEADIRRRLGAAGLTVTGSVIEWDATASHRKIALDLLVMRRVSDIGTPDIISSLAGETGVVGLVWRNRGGPS